MKVSGTGVRLPSRPPLYFRLDLTPKPHYTPRMSKTDDATRLAFEKGYRVLPDGSVQSARGKVRKLLLTMCGKYPRLTFTIALKDRTVFPVGVHRLAALQKFGESCFADGICVRHADGNSLNNSLDNILIGTISDNMLDRTTEDRQVHAQRAGKAASRHSDELWERVRNDHRSGLGYKKLRDKYGISISTLSYQLSSTGKRIQLDRRA